MPATKEDVQIEKIRSDSEKFGLKCGLVEHFISVGTLLGAIYLILKGLEPFLSANPEAITAIAKIVEQFNFSNMTAYLLSGGLLTAYTLERKGKKRAIKEKGKYQRMVEAADEHRSSSGLTSDGDTPRGGGK